MIRLARPAGPIEMPSTDTLSEESASSVAASSRATSAGFCGIIATLATSAPASPMARNVASSDSYESVDSKLWCEAMTAIPASRAEAMSPGASARSISTSTAKGTGPPVSPAIRPRITSA